MKWKLSDFPSDSLQQSEGAHSLAEYMTETARLLVVSQETAVLRPVWSVAEPHSWQVEVAANAWDAVERVQSGSVPHLLVLDLPRGDGNCLHILRWMRRLHPDLPVIVICSQEDAGRKKEATQLGADEILVRPFDDARLEYAIQRRLLANDTVEAEIASEDIEQVGPELFFVSASPAMQKLRAQAELLGEADVPVLIMGEPGSGKETVARLIHKLSVRGGFEFLKVKCADMPADLLETELFGNERIPSQGTGRAAAGKFERANKGTIFFDEITELPLALQARLIQVLQDKIPANIESSCNVRILAGTSVHIDRAIAERKLRADLYYRLSAFTVQVPSLRHRKSEITVLLRHEMHHLARHYGLPPRDFTSTVLSSCQQYPWPGNLRELQSFVKRYLVVGNTELGFDDFSTDIRHRPDADRPLEILPRTTHRKGIQTAKSQASQKSLKSLVNNIKCEAERSAIGLALRKTGWNRKAAARLLQVSYRTLLYKIDQYQMSASEPFLSPSFAGTITSGEPSAETLDTGSQSNDRNDWKQFPGSKP